MPACRPNVRLPSKYHPTRGMVSSSPTNAATEIKHQLARINHLSSCQVETPKPSFVSQHPTPTYILHYTTRFISPLFEPAQFYQAVNTSHLISHSIQGTFPRLSQFALIRDGSASLQPLHLAPPQNNGCSAPHGPNFAINLDPF